MSITIDNMSSFVESTTSNAKAASGSSLQNSLGGISTGSSDEEIKQVCKDFTSYFMEEILKEVKESLMPKEEGEDSTLSTLTDFHMDSTIEVIADQVIDEVGGGFTQQLYEQMKRNYNLD